MMCRRLMAAQPTVVRMAVSRAGTTVGLGAFCEAWVRTSLQVLLAVVAGGLVVVAVVAAAAAAAQGTVDGVPSRTLMTCYFRQLRMTGDIIDAQAESSSMAAGWAAEGAGRSQTRRRSSSICTWIGRCRVWRTTLGCTTQGRRRTFSTPLRLGINAAHRPRLSGCEQSRSLGRQVAGRHRERCFGAERCGIGSSERDHL